MTTPPASDDPNPGPNANDAGHEPDPENPGPPSDTEAASDPTPGVTPPPAPDEPPPPPHRATLSDELLERIRQLAMAGCQSLHTVEAEAREAVRRSQKGARTTVKHELETNKTVLKRAVKELK